MYKLLESDTPNSYYISLGDDLNLIPHNDKRFRTTEIDSELLQRSSSRSLVDAEVQWYIEIWKASKIPPERHLGLLEGNHSLVQTSTGINPIAYFCSEMKYPHLAEYSAVVPIVFSFGKRESAKELIIKIHHGWGGGNSRQTGADHNKFALDARLYDNWDIAIYGHTHNFFCDPVVVMDCKARTDRIDESLRLVGCSGTFLKTLENETALEKGAPYSERFGMAPRVISWLEIEVGFQTDHMGNIYFRYPRQIPSM